MKRLYAVVDLIKNSELAIPGDNLFIETMPADVTRCVMLQLPPGGDKVDRGQPDFFPGYFTVIVRDPDTEVAYDLALKLGRMLTLEDKQIGEIYFKSMWPRRLPSVYPRGDSDLVEVGVEMFCAFGITAY